LVLTLDRFVNFLSMHGNFLGSFDSQPDLVTTDVNNCDHHVVANHDALISVSRKYQHGLIPVRDMAEVTGEYGKPTQRTSRREQTTAGIGARAGCYSEFVQKGRVFLL
jgi:hypothetical protein